MEPFGLKWLARWIFPWQHISKMTLYVDLIRGKVKQADESFANPNSPSSKEISDLANKIASGNGMDRNGSDRSNGCKSL